MMPWGLAARRETPAAWRQSRVDTRRLPLPPALVVLRVALRAWMSQSACSVTLQSACRRLCGWQARSHDST